MRSKLNAENDTKEMVQGALEYSKDKQSILNWKTRDILTM